MPFLLARPEQKVVAARYALVQGGHWRGFFTAGDGHGPCVGLRHLVADKGFLFRRALCSFKPPRYCSRCSVPTNVSKNSASQWPSTKRRPLSTTLLTCLLATASEALLRVRVRHSMGGAHPSISLGWRRQQRQYSGGGFRDRLCGRGRV